MSIIFPERHYIYGLPMEQFLSALRKFMEMRTLMPIVLHELVERVDVYHVQGKGKDKT